MYLVCIVYVLSMFYVCIICGLTTEILRRFIGDTVKRQQRMTGNKRDRMWCPVASFLVRPTATITGNRIRLGRRTGHY